MTAPTYTCINCGTDVPFDIYSKTEGLCETCYSSDDPTIVEPLLWRHVCANCTPDGSWIYGGTDQCRKCGATDKLYYVPVCRKCGIPHKGRILKRFGGCCPRCANPTFHRNSLTSESLRLAFLDGYIDAGRDSADSIGRHTDHAAAYEAGWQFYIRMTNPKAPASA